MTLTLRPIGAAMSGLATRGAAAFERRRTLRQISRLSDRRLHDIGLERDWDGSILGNGRAI
ncbi:DUF1127 domain-containing protein [Mesorhizobium sp. B2-5-4]|uniref:DUF1127 domain-containing protein n=1 Tax=unclassified Mesorhizobium TaxID=325217 RepID=UPI00112788BD|nr:MULTISPECIES: DUF1127 domain-containing protein [unclassified Mesorhizobium]TPJ37795.1 DUF1127 domain-containing protein [Mesorhizobium sp. B2-6-5]TPJ77307.1 DUF1127 domain-containing protein [Mesorhizobium sp. B2-5-13]TPK41804.1 DUF1127 domain-containing protein [Mesorhizobium sp. B2-5-4]TPK44642.1 DUF1127 domain-containing protein [Mesorhizobium sp. B2-5-5]TPL79162.1 DUF1127 domain-containing protein [Mesorhizobium sp. B2-3-13]